MARVCPGKRVRGFSLLELTLALGIAGMALGGLWQIGQTAGLSTQARLMGSQALAVAGAARGYVAGNRTAILTALPAIDDAAEILVSDVQAAGYLPADFVNQNAYGQTYRVLVKREDAGAAGADAADNLVTLVVTSGGATVTDSVGSRVVSAMGAAGGFIFSDATGTARGAAGGWQVNLAGAGWSGIAGYTPAAGQVAVLANILPPSAWGVGSSSGGGASALDDLSDAATDYTTYYNLFIGDQAGAANTTASFNTAVGSWTLRTNTVGANNTAIGQYALTANTTVSNNTAVGNSALIANTTGASNTAVGKGALFCNIIGDGNTGMGYQAGDTWATGSYNTFLGYNTDADADGYTNGMALGNGAVLTGSNRIVLGNASITDIYAQVTSITGLSDGRHKRDVADQPLGLDFIEQLRTRQYRFDNGDDTLRLGIIAQELADALPDTLRRLAEKPGDHGLALLSRENNAEGTYRVAYGELTAPLIKAVQELAARHTALSAETDDTEQRIARLKARLAHFPAASRPGGDSGTLDPEGRGDGR